jgi:ATP-dependent RNA helicase HelY
MADIGRVALSPPPDLHSSFRPTYNFTANLIHHVDYDTAVTLLERSYAQFEANRRPGGARRPLTELLTARHSVLEELGFAEGWSLTDKGRSLRRVYHENDLLLTEAWAEGVFDDIEESSLAALLSCFVYEGRRSKPKPVAKGTQQKKPKVIKDRLGPGRRADMADRLALVRSVQSRVIEVEGRYRVRHAKDLDDGFSRAMAAWARGASLSTALEVADAETGFMAPGDFVRHAKQVADLCEQLSHLDLGDLGEVAARTKLAVVRSVVAGALAIPTFGESES